MGHPVHQQQSLFLLNMYHCIWAYICTLHIIMVHTTHNGMKYNAKYMFFTTTITRVRKIIFSLTIRCIIYFLLEWWVFLSFRGGCRELLRASFSFVLLVLPWQFLSVLPSFTPNPELIVLQLILSAASSHGNTTGANNPGSLDTNSWGEPRLWFIQ